MRYVSKIHQFFTKELMIGLNKICHDVLIEDNNTKVNKMVELLDKYEVPYTELGPGTNRFAIMIDGYVFKIAMDKDGIRDNLAEFSMGMELQPFVTKVYECNGLMIVAEYVTVISKDEFQRSKEEIRQILTHISQGYLLGDVGTVTKNFMNWGYRQDGSLVILDFAYIYRVIGEEMLCSNIINEKEEQCGAILEYDDNYHNLICPRCRHKYTFHDIRRRISRQYEERELNAIKQIAVKMSGPTLDVLNSANTIKPILNNNEGENDMKKSRLFDEDFVTDEESIDSYQDALDFLKTNDEPVVETEEENNSPEFNIPDDIETESYCDDDDDDCVSATDFMNELSKREDDDEESDGSWESDPDDEAWESDDTEESAVDSDEYCAESDDVKLTPFEALRQRVADSLEIVVGDDLVLRVINGDGDIVLSSNVDEAVGDVLYCHESKLVNHVGHFISGVCYRKNKTEEIDNVAIECEYCNEVLFSLDKDEVYSVSEPEETEVVSVPEIIAVDVDSPDIPDIDNNVINIKNEVETVAVGTTPYEQPSIIIEPIAEAIAEDIREEIIDEAKDTLSVSDSGSVLVYEPEEECNAVAEKCEETAPETFSKDDVLVLSNENKEDIAAELRNELLADMSTEPSSVDEDEYESLYDDADKDNLDYKFNRSRRNFN